MTPPPTARAGYTLLEIMIVVVVLGLLATLVVPRIMGRPEEARRTKAIADLASVAQALNLYRLDNGGYPTTEQGLEALVRRPERPPSVIGADYVRLSEDPEPRDRGRP